MRQKKETNEANLLSVCPISPIVLNYNRLLCGKYFLVSFASLRIYIHHSRGNNMNERAIITLEEKSDKRTQKKMKTPDDYIGYSTDVYAEFGNMETKKE